MTSFRTLFPTLLLFVAVGRSNAQEQSHSLVLPELPHLSVRDQIVEKIAFEFSQSFKGTLQLRTYQWRSATDSLLVFEAHTKTIAVPAGISARVLKFNGSLAQYRLQPDFENLLKRFGRIPPGIYRIEVILKEETDTVSKIAFQNFSVVHNIDSSLGVNSKLRNRINSTFADKEKEVTQKAKSALTKKKSGAALPTIEEEEKSSRKLQKSLDKIKGVNTQVVSREGKVYSELYYKDWFLGRHELANTQAMQNAAQEEIAALKAGATGRIKNELEDFSAISTQVRTLFDDKSQKQELKGNIDLNFFGANSPDPYSQVDPNYMDVYAGFQTEISKVPVMVEGYYTTQDRNRIAKASYFRIKYDVEAAKSKLTKLVNGYRSKFSESASKGDGLQQVWGNYTQQLHAQSARLVQQTSAEYGLPKDALAGETITKERAAELFEKETDSAALIAHAKKGARNATEDDSASNAARQKWIARRQKAMDGAETLQKRQADYQSMVQKTEKYTALLARYKTQLHLDSGLNYNRINEVAGKDWSYKEMSKAAAGLMPEGKARRALTGVTHLEAGVLDRYESGYTLAGQTMKGVSGGYDFGPLKAGVTAGFTEYANRQGQIDRYTSYMLRMDSKEIAKQKIGLVYYGYSPTREILVSDNFVGKRIASDYPTFSKPVHIVSVVQSGRVGKSLSLESEAAVSLQKDNKEQAGIGLGNMALKAGGAWSIPKTPVGLLGEWEHMGRYFENRSMPIARAGTERYMAGIDVSLFRSFLYVKVTWNHLLQQGLYTESGNTRWGFDVRTRSKRYPNVQVAYKPFSSFRTVSDTFVIAQRPLTGEVWLARGTYQLKQKGGTAHRFLISFNRNVSSGGDTISYASTVSQLGYNYTSGKLLLGITAGAMQLPQTDVVGTAGTSGYSGGNSWYANTTQMRVFGPVTLSAGQEIAFAAFGLQRIGGNAGCGYRFSKLPLTLRGAVRYARYQLSSAAPAGNLFAGQLGVGWRFAVPLKDPTTEPF